MRLTFQAGYAGSIIVARSASPALPQVEAILSSELYAEDADAGQVIDYMSAMAGDVCGGKNAASAEKEPRTAGMAVAIDPRLIAFMLPGIPESVRIARFYVRAALGLRGLSQYVGDLGIVRRGTP